MCENDDDVRFLLGLRQDRRIVNAGVNDDAVLQMRLVLLSFLNRAPVPIEILVTREALYGLADTAPRVTGEARRARGA